MSTRTSRAVVAALAGVIATTTAAAGAPGAGPTGWVKTAQGPDASDGTPSVHTEYVVPSSIVALRGGDRTAFVKVTYAPGVDLGQGVVTTEIAQVEVGCSTISWGTITKISFDATMVPLLAETGTYDTTKPIWTLKGMEPIDPKAITYATAKYICTHGGTP